ncbi:MAG: hypothetical protein A3I09_02085 [Deltaproteobacteria bacterium RIFCSPLOWO2_02_FULL_47_10]|nr:MAG: hypothetical protein A3I09_02085 [Deltaproteobacteria bacterium RIFCSPLOWO2_02_FULL_47_10]
MIPHSIMNFTLSNKALIPVFGIFFDLCCLIPPGYEEQPWYILHLKEVNRMPSFPITFFFFLIAPKAQQPLLWK